MVAITVVCSTDDGYQRTEHQGEQDGKERDDKCIAQSLQEILITIARHEASLKLFCKRLFGRSNASTIHDNYLTYIGI